MVKAPHEYLWIIFRLVFIGSSYCSDVCHRNSVSVFYLSWCIIIKTSGSGYVQVVMICRWELPLRIQCIRGEAMFAESERKLNIILVIYTVKYWWNQLTLTFFSALKFSEIHYGNLSFKVISIIYKANQTFLNPATSLISTRSPVAFSLLWRWWMW